MLNSPGRRAYALLNKAYANVKGQESLAYLTAPARHAFLCREVCSLIRAQHEPLPSEVIVELMEQLSHFSEDKAL